jgi:ATP-dependent DNA ligase
VAQEQVLHRKATLSSSARTATARLRALLATADGHNFTYAGAAFIGLRGAAWETLGERLKHLAIKQAPLRGLRMKDAQWVEPRITAKVRHLAGAKYLRHAVVRTAKW